MNLEEARKVLWLQSNPRPLEELLNEGYLDKERLEWAAEWAFNFKLKQAAKVLLEAGFPIDRTKSISDTTSKTPIEIPISMDKARATLWPFAPYKGQLLGSLVDSQQLSLKDLGYAVENAWDEKVRQAAIALSLVRLEQVVKEPAPDAGYVHVISGGKSYSERKQAWFTFLEGVVLGILIPFLVYLIWWLVQDILKPHPNARPIAELMSSPTQMIVFLILLGLVILGGLFLVAIPDQITKRLEKQIEEHRLGQDGEDRTVQMIVQVLDGNWYLFRNMRIPGQGKGDLDLVLIGPPGVWVLEVKNFNGTYRNIGETWELMCKKKWKPAYVNPSRQANKNSLELKNFLKADNINIFVNAAVVWANPESLLFIENPAVAIWQYNRLTDELGNLWHGEKLSQEERTNIVDKLSKLCKRQKLEK